MGRARPGDDEPALFRPPGIHRHTQGLEQRGEQLSLIHRHPRRIHPQKQVRIPGQQPEIVGLFQIEDGPPLPQFPEERGLAALPGPDDGHAGKMAEIFPEEVPVGSFHLLYFKTIRLILQ
jgi:hypothetical protein